jgi:predicted MPP superfamily phosphohydrolase
MVRHTRVIDGKTNDMDDGTTPRGQEILPFAELPAQTRRQALRRFMRTGVNGAIKAAAHALRHEPRAAAVAVVAFLLRWVLRIALPFGGAAAMLHLFPYRASAGGAHFRIEGTLVTRSGLSADTTFGNWEFKHVDGLPIGAHIRPENLDVVKLASAATRNGQLYVDGLRADLERQAPRAIAWLIGEALIGMLVGLAMAAAINLAVRYVRNRPHRAHEWRHRAVSLAAAFGVVALIGGYGAITYNTHWVRESRVTGTLGALQLFPGQLSQYYAHQSKFFDVISAIAGIQAQLQQHIDQNDSEPPAYNIMFISDMHLASTYPLVQQYASNFGVSLIINTGDESEFGSRAEMTPAYLAQIRSITKDVPMIWLAGNHDSPATVDVMRSIPGVTVLGGKTMLPDDGYSITAQQVSMFGLTIAAVPDPRVYAGGGDFGSNDDKVVHALERKAVDQALRGVSPQQTFDIFATHEPTAAEQLRHDLPGRIRQTNAGHLHAQNADKDVQHDGAINLIEGSAGAGGLDNINRGVPAPPIEFSIESVAASCQFTKLVRFQIAGPPPEQGVEPATGQQVTASTIYLDPQKVDPGRICAVSQGSTAVQDLGSSP